MNGRFLCTAALVTGAALSLGAAAQPYSRIDQETINRIMPRAKPVSAAEYKVEMDRITTEYVSAMALCNRFLGRPKGMCSARAKASETISLAELDARFRNTEDAYREAIQLRTKADYAIARQECESIARRARFRCLNYAKALYGQS